MTTKNKKITTSQFCLIMAGIFMAVRPIVENALQAKFVGNDCLITSMVAGIINLFLAIIVCVVINKNPGKSFFEIMSNFLGTITTKIIMIMLAVVFVFKMLLIDYQMTFLLYDAVYTDINWLLFAAPLIMVVCFVAIKGIKVIARCYQIFMPFALLIFITTLFVAGSNANFEKVMPLFTHSQSQFFTALNYILIQSCEYIFLFTFMENIISKKEYYFTKISITFVIIFILVELFYLIFIAVLGRLAPFVRETLITMTQFKDPSYGYFKIDIFTTIFWIPLVVLQNTLCVYSVAYCLNKVFNLKTEYGCVLTVVGLFITHFIPQINNQTVTNFYYEKIGIFVLAFLLVLPIILLLASFKKPKKEKDNGKN